MADFNPVTLYFILYESMGVWLFILAGVAILLLVGVIMMTLRLGRTGRPAKRPAMAAIAAALVVTVVFFFLVPGWTLAGIGALSGVVDYAFAALLALVPGVAAGAIVFMLAARRCTAKSMRQPVSA
ncbi:hypothetical protein [Aminobacter sp. J44]|uniref:hypothetical protein n=1 Tax=Aminobacter sp. J44 TaxID=935262 RepID=UPI00119A6382|nr:hypothetical protein [Aminobacter sp. J44]TWG55325.1 hypothetical protein L610_003100000310 [Aminobacter sp. J44]